MTEVSIDNGSASAIERGARNAVAVCLGVGVSDRVVIITDSRTLEIGQALQKASAVAASSELLVLENYGPRPFRGFPEPLKESIVSGRPTVTFFAAQGRQGEIRFRRPLLDYLIQEMKVRHGHMINIEPRLMVEGMSCDYQRIAAITNRVCGLARRAKEISVVSAKGTDLRATFSPELCWVPCTGIYHQQGQWGNLPEGETFTCPALVDGVLAGDLVGDHFSEEYGLLDVPIRVEIANSRVVSISSENQKLQKALSAYLKSSENGDRVGEFAIGTNVCLSHLTGNLLQDEKFPGVHLAFGNPYPFETGAKWSSEVHVDIISTGTTILMDGRAVMNEGQFLPEVLALAIED